MPTTSALPSTPADLSAFKAQGNAFSDISSEEFVRIMFAELGNQDPLKPNDANQLLEQMSSLRSIESDLALTQKLDALVAQNQLSAAGGLIGASVTGLDEENRRVRGTVVSISRTSDGPVINLHTGARVPFEQVDEITDPRLAGPAPGSGTPASPSAPSTPALTLAQRQNQGAVAARPEGSGTSSLAEVVARLAEAVGGSGGGAAAGPETTVGVATEVAGGN